MVIANSVKTSTPNYVIADISLSDFGCKEIKIAETEIKRFNIGLLLNLTVNFNLNRLEVIL